jgi:Ca2+-binding RTX toxin-like protein
LSPGTSPGSPGAAHGALRLRPRGPQQRRGRRQGLHHQRHGGRRQPDGHDRDDVICSKAVADFVAGEEGNDVILLGQGDDYGAGEDGSDVVKGQADDDYVRGLDQNDELYCGQGADCVGENCGDPNSEAGSDFIKTRDGVSGNDIAHGGANTDTCRVDAVDTVTSCCEL